MVPLVEPFLSVRELSQRLGVREGTLRQWKNRGQGPRWFKVNQALLYWVSDVEAWEAEQREDATA